MDAARTNERGQGREREREREIPVLAVRSSPLAARRRPRPGFPLNGKIQTIYVTFTLTGPLLRSPSIPFTSTARGDLLFFSPRPAFLLAFCPYYQRMTSKPEPVENAHLPSSRQPQMSKPNVISTRYRPYVNQPNRASRRKRLPSPSPCPCLFWCF
jgi:hypothetical protein